ncbi:MAG: hypothetical protein U5K84_06510 [Alkalibacterium sp.]|nr:hypothetical protein [Alkalibacterium sp.]
MKKACHYKELRLGFGKQVLENVLNLMKEYRQNDFPLDTHVYQTALSNLRSYIAVHDEAGFIVDHLKEMAELETDTPDSCTGGVFYKTKKMLLNSRNRISRRFPKAVTACVTIRMSRSIWLFWRRRWSWPNARRRPVTASPGKYVSSRIRKLKKTIQKNQNGNRGFGDYIDKFIIITADVQYYDRIRERNQANIDGACTP